MLKPLKPPAYVIKDSLKSLFAFYLVILLSGFFCATLTTGVDTLVFMARGLTKAQYTFPMTSLQLKLAQYRYSVLIPSYKNAMRIAQERLSKEFPRIDITKYPSIMDNA